MAKSLPEKVYRHFYSLPHITPKEMANLICDKDQRDKTLKYDNSEFKNTLQRIMDAIKREDLTIEGEVSVYSVIDSRTLFLWACNTYPEFNLKLPLGMVKNKGGVTLDLLEFDVQSCGLDLPDTYQELRNKYVSLHMENIELKEEVKRLSVFEKKKIGKLDDSAKGGKNSKGTKKEY